MAADSALSAVSAGSDVDVQLAGPGVDVLRTTAEEVKQRLRGYAGVYEVTDSFRAGKQEMKLGIKPAAETAGLRLQSRRVRQAFYGEEAQRIQRGRDDVRVMVRYPRDERRSPGDLENMRIRTPDGGQAPCPSARSRWSSPGAGSRRSAVWTPTGRSTSPPPIDPGVTSADAVIADLNARILPEVLAGYPVGFYTLEGAMAESATPSAGCGAVSRSRC